MTDRFTELKNDAYQSSQVIAGQLQSVESSVLGAFLSILISAFISERLGLLFWIPASFLAMWLVTAFSLVKSTSWLLRLLLAALLVPLILILAILWSLMPFMQRPLSSILRIIFKLWPRLLQSSSTEQSGNVETAGVLSYAKTFSIITSFKNVTPFLKAIGVIFLVSLLSLLLYKIGLIGEDYSFSITIPVVSCILLMSLPIFMTVSIAKLEKMKFELDFTKLGSLRFMLVFICGVLGVLYGIFTTLVFPIWSFRVLAPIYVEGLPSILSITVVMALLVITALAFMNYFSASLVRKEMGIALFHLSNIQNRIEGLSVGQSIPDEIYQELKEEYARARRYNMTTDDSLFLVNYYSLRPDATYLAKLDRR
jgi:hypothetical protein